eukprot:TRINITY_DN7272_c0_g1_i3.p1 TRINITY_DN7272_c0_g1~~TRINITY_DN7272_c0_g1_i3.p1  ORF type:complete len:416 (+),score=68.73 TRINITY_DN7272_c0_g1_i3:691-1938(+)
MDMVCSANEGTTHDFHTDPLKLYQDDGWLKAKGTTLGADDGIGVAVCLALLSDPLSQHGPLEVLLTVDEESTMSGAEFLDDKILDSMYLINLDSEAGNAICIGCAGGFEVDIDLPVQREAPKPEDNFVEIFLHGMVGGHSGVDIHKGRGNALVSGARIVDIARETISSVRLCTLSSGTAVNSIPRESKFVVAVSSQDVDGLLASVAQSVEILKQEYSPVESAIGVKTTIVEQGCAPTTVLSSSSTEKVLDLILTLPNGMIRMVPHNFNDVETSINLGIASLGIDGFNIHPFARSSSVTQMKCVQKQLESHARLAGATISGPINSFPGWDPAKQVNGKLLEPTRAVLQRVYGEPPKVYSIHAGLECGLFMKAYPSLECISIGPIIEDAHTPDERCHIQSVGHIFQVVQHILLSVHE